MKRPKLFAIPRRMLALRAAFRWKYVLPRVTIAAALVLSVRYALDPLLKYALVAGGEAALGAKVEVTELSTSLLDGKIVVEGFAAANPQKPLRNLVEAEHLHLNFDVAALTHKRLVVKSGMIRGLQFDSERAASGALEPTETEAKDAGPSLLDPVFAAASDSATAWFESLQGRVEEDLESKLATLRVLRELEERWQRQHAALKTRADELRARAKQIESEFNAAKENPLRGLSQIEAMQKQLASTQTDLKAALDELKSLPAQAKADRAAVDAARKQDEQFLRNAVNVAKTDGEQLSQYLLGETVHGYVSQSVGWAGAVRSWIPKSKMERPSRLRGTNVLFVDRRRPQLLIERVALSGTARVNGQPLEITGALTDATSEPKFHGEPMRLQLKSTGAIGGELVVTIDRRGDQPHDKLVLDCPHLALAERSLGKADKLAVSVAAGEASLAAKLQLDGDQLSGVITLRQSATLEARTPALRDDRLAEMLRESLAEVDRLEAEITLAGTLRSPEWKLESNLGPQLSAGINTAVRRYLTDRRDRLVAKVQGQADEQLAKLEAKRQEAQTELLAKLGENQALVGQLASLLGGKPSLEGLSVPQIGSALKLDRLTR